MWCPSKLTGQGGDTGVCEERETTQHTDKLTNANSKLLTYSNRNDRKGGARRRSLVGDTRHMWSQTQICSQIAIFALVHSYNINHRIK